MQRFREACTLSGCRTNPKAAAALLTSAAAAFLLLAAWYSGIIPAGKAEYVVASPIILSSLSRRPPNGILGIISDNVSPRVLKTRRIKLPIDSGYFPRRALDDRAANSHHVEDQAGRLKCSDIMHKERCQRTEGCIFSESEKSSACMVNEADTAAAECYDILNIEDCWGAQGCAFDWSISMCTASENSAIVECSVITVEGECRHTEGCMFDKRGNVCQDIDMGWIPSCSIIEDGDECWDTDGCMYDMLRAVCTNAQALKQARDILR